MVNLSFNNQLLKLVLFIFGISDNETISRNGFKPLFCLKAHTFPPNNSVDKPCIHKDLTFQKCDPTPIPCKTHFGEFDLNPTAQKKA